jgi:hypothetical protein
MKIVLASLALASLAAPTLAHASSCGGGGGSSGGSSSGGGSSGGGSDGSSTVASCSDTTDVVGYRQCTKYGAWSASTRWPLLIFELGLGVQTFDNPLREGSGSVEHEGEHFTYRVSGGGDRGNDPAAAVAVVTTARLGVGTALGLYTAVELELGGLARDQTRVEMTSTGRLGAPTIEQTSAIAMGALGVVGFQKGTSRLLLGAEVLGGVRAVSYSYYSQYLACQQTSSILVGRGVVEARARASYFVTPMLSVGAQLGTSLVDQRDWNMGVYLGGYTRAFATSR